MKQYHIYRSAIIILLLAVSINAYQCAGSKKSAQEEHFQTIETNINGKGLAITVEFRKGEAHNHPLMAIWIDDTDEKYIETLYVAESIGKGIFRHGEKSKGQWMPGPIRRPAALPYWGHQRGIQAPDGYFLPTPDNPVADAITGPTPPGNFILKAKTTEPMPQKFRLLLEINQSWDWNEYWTNSKYPDDDEYKTSSQPSLVYMAEIDTGNGAGEYDMRPIGHGHYSGKDGSLDPDLSTLTTAMNIVKNIRVKVL